MDNITLTKDKWSDQIIHKKFKNQSFGHLNHKIRHRFSKPSRCTNSTKTHSVLTWKNKHCTKCIHRRNLMRFYKYSCIHPDYDIETISDPDTEGDTVDLIECKRCKYVNKSTLSWCYICNHNLHIPDIYPMPSDTHFNITYISNRKRKKNKRKLKRTQTGSKYGFEQYWNEMKTSHNEYQKLSIYRQKHSKKRLYLLKNGAFNNCLKFKIVVGSAEKLWSYYWSQNDQMSMNTSFVLQNEIMLSSKMKLIINYVGIKNGVEYCNNSPSNIASIYFGNDTYDVLKKKQLLKSATAKLCHLKTQNVPWKYIEAFVSKSKVNIDEYSKPRNINGNVECKYEHSLSFDMMITTQQDIEYEYLQNNVSMIGKKSAVLMGVPMKLKNYTLRQCCINIHDNITGEHKMYNCLCPAQEEIYLPIYSCPYKSVYAASLYPKTYAVLKNYALKQVVIQCIMACFDDNTHAYNQMIKRSLENNLTFNECHEPYYNLLPLSFKLSRFLMDYLPIRHIIKKVLIPYVGYNMMHYISMDACVEFECEEERIVYMDENCFEDGVSILSYNMRTPHVLERNGNIIDKDIVLLSVNGHEYIEDSDTDNDDALSLSSDESSRFVDLFGSSSDDW